MAITVDDVKKYIDTVGGNVIQDIAEDTISLVAFSKYNNTLEQKDSYMIYLRENGELIQFVSGIGKAKKLGIDNCALFEALLNHNASMKFGSWDYDISDDQINYTVEIPLEDNTITEKQFKRIVKLLENGTVEFMKMLIELRKSSNSDGI